MNFALTDEQEFLKEAARGALVALQDRRGGPRGARRRRAARPVADRGRGRLARPAGLRGARRRRARRDGGDARVRRARPRARRRAAARPPAGDVPARPRRRRRRSRRSPPATRARRSCPAKPPSDVDDRLDRRRAGSAPRARPAPGSPTTARSPARCPGCPTRPAPTCSSSSATTAAPPRVAGAPTPTVEPVDGLRRDALARPRALRRRARRRCSSVPDGARPPPGTSPRRCWPPSRSARSRSRSRSPSPTPRSASRSAARSAPTRRSSTSSWRSCGGSRTPARSCTTRAGRAQDKPDEFPLAASAFRLAAGQALDHAARAQISVHGGIGATWEHDAPLYFRRAQLSRRLLGGHGRRRRPRGRRAARARGDEAAA